MKTVAKLKSFQKRVEPVVSANCTRFLFNDNKIILSFGYGTINNDDIRLIYETAEGLDCYITLSTERKPGAIDISITDANGLIE